MQRIPGTKAKISKSVRSGDESRKAGKLNQLIALYDFVDNQVEKCLKKKFGLQHSLDTIIPLLLKKVGAVGFGISVPDESLEKKFYFYGEYYDRQTHRSAEKKAFLELKKFTFEYLPGPDVSRFARPVDIVGRKIGQASIIFKGNTGPEKLSFRKKVFHILCEGLDDFIFSIYHASLKQKTIMDVQNALGHKVFEKGLDRAVKVLTDNIELDKLIIFFYDDSGVLGKKLNYRYYQEGKCRLNSVNKRYQPLDKLLSSCGHDLKKIKSSNIQLCGQTKTIETILISGITDITLLGKLFVTPKKSGLNTLSLDILNLFASSISQRLIDYNRERRQLSKMFSPRQVRRLLNSPGYQEKYLDPREKTVAVVYADISGFTRLSEKKLVQPRKIAEFINLWSTRAVEIIFENDGVFDKMVGDCVIGLFGPPFFDLPKPQRLINALKAAVEIRDFTSTLKYGNVSCPGVSIGVNLCSMCVGTFGPNLDYTGFSKGMNNTARLQEIAGFQEILVMDNAYEAVKNLNSDPFLKEYVFLKQVPVRVKNVSKPLNFYRLEKIRQ